LRFHNALQ